MQTIIDAGLIVVLLIAAFVSVCFVANAIFTVIDRESSDG